ncbi:DUF6753 family protein [Nodularia spumigena]|jgi:hypothetical protein|uniref:DUF6753 family protein n=1 Tax=Nodularia spumigena UHCC 0060 TaxID=3110300 RepID=A0ABU5URD4_NODSP|nr:DUF6753 family protein [Nodularia spumigena]MEA5526698.1 DUF6753 family protein [Nodularia spumigena UHCC 0143]MEA5608463.1 DUF6753 family protein [Nodularia spumigena UHCC 0060]MEA5613018.1 DUF6753 family protein [Nodularia spumigena UHCC 0040]
MTISMEDAMRGYSELEQAKIQELSLSLGISPDDPMFQIMLTLGRYEETMIEIPARMEAMVEAWAVLIDRKLEQTSKTTQSMHYAVVSSSVREVLAQELPNLSPKMLEPGKMKLGIWPISAIFGGVMAAGALLGSLTTWNIVANYVGAASIITNNDLQLLLWVKSEEGKFAREILKDNQSTISACKADENRLQGHCLIKIK